MLNCSIWTARKTLCAYGLQGLKRVVEKLLRHFVHRNGGQQKNILPKRMLYYRDGVSESQFQKVQTAPFSVFLS